MPPTLSGGNYKLLQQLPGHHKWQDRNMVARCTGQNIAFILETWPDAEWIGGSEKYKNDYLLSVARGEEISKAKADPAIIDDSGYAYKRAPMDHQRKAFGISREMPAFGLFMEQGTGKTKVTIDTACYLYRKAEIDAMIIVAWPNGVHRNWIEYELPADMSIPYAAEYWSGNYSAKYRQKAFEKFLDTEHRIRVFAFNIEAFVGEEAKKMMLKMLGKWKCLLVIDQSASIKNPASKRTKFLIDKCAHLASYRRILDGAPVAEGADELYSQFKFLDSKIIGHDTWTSFKAEFCKIGYFNEIVGYQNLPELRRRVDGYSYRVLANDCLDLPERIYKVWPFELAGEEKRIFDSLKARSLAFFDKDSDMSDLVDEDPDAPTEDLPEHIQEDRAMIKNLRLQQISSGWWPSPEPKAIEEGEKPSRLKALMTLLEQADGKAIIFARFRADLELIQRTLGKLAVSYHGGVDEEDREEAKRQFMDNPKVKYFIGQPRSAGIGHTLTAARHIIFYSNDSSLRLREECEKRAHRKGLTTKLLIWDLQARDTQDLKIIRALKSKKELANEIMEDPDNFFLNHE